MLGRYTVVRRDWPGRNFRLSPFLGIKAPTGEDDATDALGRLPLSVQMGSGSWDPFVGVVVTYQTLDYQVDSQFSYRANNEANNFQAGDITRLDGSLQYRLYPRELAGGVPGFLYGVIEVNLIHQDHNRVAGRTQRTASPSGRPRSVSIRPDTGSRCGSTRGNATNARIAAPCFRAEIPSSPLIA